MASVCSLDCCEQTLAIQHRSEEHTSELQSRSDLVCRLLLEKKKKKKKNNIVQEKKTKKRNKLTSTLWMIRIEEKARRENDRCSDTRYASSHVNSAHHYVNEC